MHSSESSQGDSEFFENELTRRAIAAQRCPPLSKQRQEALEELFNEIRRIRQQGRLWKPHDYKINIDIYEDAIQELSLYICQKLEKYDPQRASFLRWINMLLPRKFYDLAYSNIGDKYVNKFVTIDSLENSGYRLISQSEMLSLLEEVKQCINSDVEEIFRKEHIREQLHVNFQILAQRRLAGESWRDIAVDVGISVQYLNKFYQRCLKKFALHIKNYVQQ